MVTNFLEAVASISSFWHPDTAPGAHGLQIAFSLCILSVGHNSKKETLQLIHFLEGHSVAPFSLLLCPEGIPQGKLFVLCTFWVGSSSKAMGGRGGRMLWVAQRLENPSHKNNQPLQKKAKLDWSVVIL